MLSALVLVPLLWPYWQLRAQGYVRSIDEAAFFAAGFVFDMVTVGRIDAWATITQQAA